jgi:hypothetical protein
MIYAEANVACVDYVDDCNMYCWLQWISLTIARLYLKSSLNTIFDPLREEVIVNFVQSTTYSDLSFLVATRRFLLESLSERLPIIVLLSQLGPDQTHIPFAASAS